MKKITYDTEMNTEEKKTVFIIINLIKDTVFIVKKIAYDTKMNTKEKKQFL